MKNYHLKTHQDQSVKSILRAGALALLGMFAVGMNAANAQSLNSAKNQINEEVSELTKGILISGRVTDNSGNPVDLATVRLIRITEGNTEATNALENVVNSTYSEMDGSYFFSDVPAGTYKVSVSLLGHSIEYSDPIIIKSDTKMFPGVNFKLNMTSNTIETVTVTAERPLVQRKPDMLVVNVENSPIAAGNSALEVLQRSPGVTMDKDDNISLMGKQGVMVMIDGKPSQLSSSQLADFLRNTDANTIRSIELITNPSSKYDAAGSSGIINIVLKKNRLEGTTGSVSVAAGYGMNRRSNSSLNLSHKTEKFNAYGTVSYMNNGLGQNIDIDRTIMNGGVGTVMSQASVIDRISRSVNYRAGLDYHTSSRNTMSLLVSGYDGNNDMGNNAWTSISTLNAGLDSNLNSTTNGKYLYGNKNINFNNQFRINEEGRNLTLDVDVSRYKSDATTNYSNTFYLPNGDLKGNPLLSRSFTPTTIDIRTAKLDYVHPLSEKATFETGFKYSWIESDNNMLNELFSNGTWIPDLTRNNHFVYDEHISAAYAVYKDKFGKLGVQAGLRAEYTINNGNSVTLSNKVKQDYLDLFPTLFLNYDASDDHQFGLSYSKRINRPHYQFLNPFKYFLDQYTYSAGNPYLKAEYAHAFEGSYSLKSKYHLSLGYSITNDVILESMGQDNETKIGYVMRDNVAKQKQFYANLNVPIKITRYWNTNTNVTGFYLGFEGMMNNAMLDQGQFAAELMHNHSFKINPDLNLETTLNYQTPLVYSLYHIGNEWGVDLGASYSIMNKKGSLRLSATDVFNTRQQNIRTNHSDLNVKIFQKHDTRVVRLTFTYNFGNMKNRVQQRDLNSDEKSRVGGMN